MITNIKLKYGDSDIELTLDEAKELYKDLHELFGKEKVVSVPPSWPHPEFYRPSGPSYTVTTTPLTDWRQQPYCGPSGPNSPHTTTPYSLQDGLLQSPQTGASMRCDHVNHARVAGTTAGKGSKGKK